MEFIKAQVDAGIKPQKKHFFGDEFANRKFAVMIEGSWMPNTWSNLTKQQIDNIGFIPMFPVPDNKTKTSTMMGGWELGIPANSLHKNIAWEIIENMLKPEVLSPWLAKQGFLPTQTTLGQDTNPFADHLRKSVPFYDDMISMIYVNIRAKLSNNRDTLLLRNSFCYFTFYLSYYPALTALEAHFGHALSLCSYPQFIQ